MIHPLFICPKCRSNLDQIASDHLTCPNDKLDFKNVDGIWRFLRPGREKYYSDFVKEYETVRQYEGRGSRDAEYYRVLPFQDLSGNFAADWAIRALSFKILATKILAAHRKRLSRPLKILDLGAGNGWLSNRLAERGSQVTAVDLLVNERDGLGTWKHYKNRFVPIQAEFNHLPITNKSIDVAIFNASFHYSENYEATLQESLRVINEYGLIVIMDSPIYHLRKSGEKMVAEREADFLERFGFTSNSLESENFLTYQRVRDLGETLAIRWEIIRPYHGLRWLLRPIIARLLGRREPAKFHLLIARG